MNKNTLLCNTARNLILQNRALKIIQEFKKENIDFLILRGLYLAFGIYSNPGLRPMADIDILIKKRDLDRMVKILRKLGYIKSLIKAKRIHLCGIDFRNENNIWIDIHWDLCKYEKFKGIIDMTDDFWNRVCEFNLEGIPVKTLSIEDHILYTSFHYALGHLLQQTQCIYDLFYLIDDRQVKWKDIIDNAYKYKINIPLYYSLFKASQITNLKLPDFVLKRLEPHWLRKKIIDYLLRIRKGIVLNFFCQVLMVGNTADTLKILWRLLKSPRRM